MMTFSLQITDQKGGSATRELAAKTIGRTEHKLACSPDAYRISTN